MVFSWMDILGFLNPRLPVLFILFMFVVNLLVLDKLLVDLIQLLIRLVLPFLHQLFHVFGDPLRFILLVHLNMFVFLFVGNVVVVVVVVAVVDIVVQLLQIYIVLVVFRVRKQRKVFLSLSLF